MGIRNCQQKRAVRNYSLNIEAEKKSQELKALAAKSTIETGISFSRIKAEQVGLVLNKIFTYAWHAIRFGFCMLKEIIRLLPAWIYELFRFCPGKYPAIPDGTSFLVTGHRGYPAKYVENTLPSFQAALENGANALEMDICFTADRNVVIWHDWNPDNEVAIVRQLGLEPTVRYKPLVPLGGPYRKPVSQLTLQEFREHYGFAEKNNGAIKVEATIPTFEEFLTWASAFQQLEVVFLDIKTPKNEVGIIPQMIAEIDALIKKHQPAIQFIFLTPEKIILEALKKERPEYLFSLDIIVPLGIVIDPMDFSSVDAAIQLRDQVASVGRQAVLALAPWTTFRRIMTFDVRRKKEYDAGAPVVPVQKLIGWTINREQEMKCLLKMGVNGLLTDRADVLRKHAESAGYRFPGV